MSPRRAHSARSIATAKSKKRSSTPTIHIDVKNIDVTVPRLPMLMSVEQTAAALGICNASVRTAIENGEIPAQLMNGRWRVVSSKLLGRWNRAEEARLKRVEAAARGHVS